MSDFSMEAQRQVGNMDQNTVEMIGRRSVTVMELPKAWSAEAARSFVLELERCMGLGRPYLVLDCSSTGQLDKLMAGLVLHCLEEAMKRNGDVKLACLSPAEQRALAGTKTSPLFESFDTVQEAISSFHQLPLGVAAGAAESAA